MLDLEPIKTWLTEETAWRGLNTVEIEYVDALIREVARLKALMDIEAIADLRARLAETEEKLREANAILEREVEWGAEVHAGLVAAEKRAEYEKTQKEAWRKGAEGLALRIEEAERERDAALAELSECLLGAERALVISAGGPAAYLAKEFNDVCRQRDAAQAEVADLKLRLANAEEARTDLVLNAKQQYDRWLAAQADLVDAEEQRVILDGILSKERRKKYNAEQQLYVAQAEAASYKEAYETANDLLESKGINAACMLAANHGYQVTSEQQAIIDRREKTKEALATSTAGERPTPVETRASEVLTDIGTSFIDAAGEERWKAMETVVALSASYQQIVRTFASRGLEIQARDELFEALDALAALEKEE